jgi:uncharacterized protein
MPIEIVALLFLAGVGGGIANAMAGGATLITFPAMLHAGLPAVIANASNAVAVTPGALVAALTDRRAFLSSGRTFLIPAFSAFAGGAIGAILLLVTPERLFTLLVPGLIGMATLIFAFSKPIQRTIKHIFGETSSDRRIMRAGLVMPSAIYGGFFGAGLGVMLLAAIAVTGHEEVRAANVLKNTLATVVNLVSVVIFISQGVVRWPETLVMLMGAICGGYLGGMLIKVIPPVVVRGIIIAVGLVMTVVYIGRYWL